jgi:hypothetical protein
VLVTGPDSESVTSTFHFMHRPLSGDASITVRVTSPVNAAEQPPGRAAVITRLPGRTQCDARLEYRRLIR